VILVLPICQRLISLIFRCKKQRKQLGAAEGDLSAKGQSGMLPAPTRRFHCRPVPLPNSVRLIAEIWLAGPDFKLSRYLPGDFVVAPVPDALPSLIVRRGDATRAPLRRHLRVTVIVQGDS
jgi:hypothetical protein